jgi:Spy/CpxP family protein refolding chaperone
MVRFLIYSLTALLFLFSLTACNKTELPSEQQSLFSQGDTDSGAEFLLVASEDPLAIEQDEAFIIDGAGPMYFWVLDLTAEQKDSIKVIVSEFRSDFTGLCFQWLEGKSWEEIRAARLALREKIRLAIYNILTDEQKAIVDEIAAQLAAGEYPDIVAEKRVEFLTENLGLSEEQQQEIYDLFKLYGSQMIQARNNSENPIDFQSTKNEIFQELDQKIRAILTAEQIDLYEQLKAEQHHLRFGGRFHGRFPRN